MRRVAELRFPLDVNDARAARADGRRDAARVPEGDVPEVQDRKAVNLPDALVPDLDQQDATAG